MKIQERVGARWAAGGRREKRRDIWRFKLTIITG
jgi:hypothetical protein